MSIIDSRTDQIIAAHSSLIVAVARACQDTAHRAELDTVLLALQRHGETALVQALRAVLAGRRDRALLRDLDEDDRIVVERLLLGLHNPATLPDPNAQPDPGAAAPGLAAIVHGAARGDPNALRALGEMSEQMDRVDGDMARLGGVLRRLMQGERNPDRLCAGMGALGESLVLSLLDELARLDQH